MASKVNDQRWIWTEFKFNFPYCASRWSRYRDSLSQLCEKYGSKKVLIPSYIAGAIALSLLGFGGNTFVIFVLVAIAGAATTGSQVLIQAYVTAYYPAQMRSTGLGVASGIGRLGGMIGPILGGFLLTLGLQNFMNFMVFAITGIVAAIALSLIADKHSGSCRRG